MNGVSEPTSCPMCGNWASMAPPEGGVEGKFAYDCVCCGRFSTTHGGKSVLLQVPSERICLLSGVARERSENGQLVEIRADNIERLIAQAPRRITDRLDHLLVRLARKSKHFGDHLALNWDEDYPIAYCQNGAELRIFVEHLQQSGMIDWTPHEIGCSCFLTLRAWLALEGKGGAVRSGGKAFAAIRLAGKGRAAYDEGVRPAIEAAGYSPILVDQRIGAEGGAAALCAEARQSRFAVIDGTRTDEEIAFFAGFAEAMGTPSIWLFQKGEGLDSPLALASPENRLVWQTPGDLRQSLEARILSLAGPGPERGF